MDIETMYERYSEALWEKLNEYTEEETVKTAEDLSDSEVYEYLVDHEIDTIVFANMVGMKAQPDWNEDEMVTIIGMLAKDASWLREYAEWGREYITQNEYTI